MKAATDPPSGHAYGTLLLLCAATSVVPGLGILTSPLAGLGSLILGLQLSTGRSLPWTPGWLQKSLSSSHLVPRLVPWLQHRFRRLLNLTFPAFPRVIAGLTVVWSSLLLILPLAFVPFSNTIPSVALGLVGVSLVAGRGLFGWLALAIAGGYTLLLVLLGEMLILAGQALFRQIT